MHYNYSARGLSCIVHSLGWISWQCGVVWWSFGCFVSLLARHEMSWDSYRDSLLTTGHVDRAAVCGLEDCGVWTQSPDFNLSAGEVKTIVTAFRNPDGLRSSGILLGGQKFLYIQSDDSQIQGKKGPSGVSVARSDKCVIIGTYREGQQPGNCRLEVERVRDHLLKSSY